MDQKDEADGFNYINDIIEIIKQGGFYETLFVHFFDCLFAHRVR
ncbi:hypothetical protein [Peptoniphilus sp. HCN-40583]